MSFRTLRKCPLECPWDSFPVDVGGEELNCAELAYGAWGGCGWYPPNISVAVTVAAPTSETVELLNEGFLLSAAEIEELRRGWIGPEIRAWEILLGEGGGFWLLSITPVPMRPENSLFILDDDSFFVAVGEV